MKPGDAGWDQYQADKVQRKKVIESMRPEMAESMTSGSNGKPEESQDHRVAESEAEAKETAQPATIIDRVADFVRTYVFFKDAAIYTLVAVWIIATYLHKEFDYMGYLFAHSPEPRSGKTTLLEVLDRLVFNSSEIQISPTEANIFRTADGHTQLFDELDSAQNKEVLRSVLNAGFKKGSVVTRSEQKRNESFTPKRYPVYAPRALAGIGEQILHRATRDRTFSIAMVRQKPSERRVRFRPRDVEKEVTLLKKGIEDWVDANRGHIVTTYKNRFSYLDAFNDRTIDITEPLATMLEVAYQGHPAFERKRTELLHAIRVTRAEQKSDESDHLILRHFLSLTENEDPLVGSATELAAQSANLSNPPNEYTIGRILNAYGFKSKSKRKEGTDAPAYRYTLSRQKLQEVVERWTSDGDDAGDAA